MMQPSLSLTVVGEDRLCCELGLKVVANALPLWTVAPPPIDAGGISELARSVPRFSDVARHGSPLLCIADSDGQCPVTWLSQSLKQRYRHDRFMLRLAVPEAEGWVLADHDGMKQHFRSPTGKLPARPDELADPKRVLMAIVQSHAPTSIRREMICRDKSGELKRASGYNVHLAQFAQSIWSPERAAQRSRSLMRALERLREWRVQLDAKSA
jgi:hypothetical protein